MCILSTLLLPQFRFATGSTTAGYVRAGAHHRLRPLYAATAEELAVKLDRVWEQTPAGRVPGVAPWHFPGNLEQLSVAERKRVFFRSLLPHVLDGNRRIDEERTQVIALKRRLDGGSPLADADRELLLQLGARYRMGDKGETPEEQVRVLLARVDQVPPGLALAQAAIESAWGTSRFARLGNNLFGQWVFHRERGIAPLERPEGANYSLAKFSDLGEAVDAYLRNLNGFYAYEEFRLLRRQMREAREPLDSYRLAGGLRHYSTRREAYVREIRAVIRSNDLTRFDHARFATVSPAAVPTRAL